MSYIRKEVTYLKVDLDEFTISQMYDTWGIFNKEMTEKYHLSHYVDYGISAVFQHLNFILIETTLSDIVDVNVPKGKRLYTVIRDKSIRYLIDPQSSEHCFIMHHHTQSNLIMISDKSVDDIVFHTDRLSQLSLFPNKILELLSETLTDRERSIEFKQELNDIFRYCIGDVWSMLSGMDKLYSQIEKFRQTQDTLNRIMKGQ